MSYFLAQIKVKAFESCLLFCSLKATEEALTGNKKKKKQMKKLENGLAKVIQIKVKEKILLTLKYTIFYYLVFVIKS
jgi:hypothetical protein